MFLFYVDKSGNLSDSYDLHKHDVLYVISAVSIFHKRWHGFESVINRKKEQLYLKYGSRLTLADCEIKSNWIRIPNERKNHPFLSLLNDHDMLDLTELFYYQLKYHHMNVFSVVIDKRYLHSYFDRDKLHRKCWELLIEMIERFLRNEHPKHQGIIIVDDEDTKTNQSLAMKHWFLKSTGTYSGLLIKNIVEMPLFTRSELSNGIQLADLIAYNIHRAFRDNDPEYPFFKRIKPHIWFNKWLGGLIGLTVFPDDTPLMVLYNSIKQGR